MTEETKDAATGAAMKVYLASRTDHVDYDEHDAFVVVAADEADARAVVAERFPVVVGYDYREDERAGFAAATVTEVDLSVRGEVLGSFNAG